jgi:hypothetical protein
MIVVGKTIIAWVILVVAFVKNMISHLFNAIRFVVGFILMVIALRAFLKTRAFAMFCLTLGFGLLTIGDAFSAIFYINNVYMDNLLSDIFDIFGMITLIIAVRKA